MKFLPIAVLIILFAACDEGLAPPSSSELGFSGTIYFKSTWPSLDSLVSLRLFASQIYPLDSAKVVAGLFQEPHTIFLYPSINESLQPFFSDSICYSFPLHSGVYKYIGAVQQISEDISGKGIRVFRVVGFFRDSTDVSQPGIVEVNDQDQVKGINIEVDFQNPPSQPF